MKPGSAAKKRLEARKKDAVRLYRQGWNSTCIAATLGVHQTSVSTYLRQEGVTRERTKARKKEIVRLYRQGWNSTRIAARLGVHQTSVSTYLRQESIGLYPQATINCALTAYANGLSLFFVAALCGVSDFLVRKWLRKNGVELRPFWFKTRLDSKFDYLMLWLHRPIGYTQVQQVTDTVEPPIWAIRNRQASD